LITLIANVAGDSGGGGARSTSFKGDSVSGGGAEEKAGAASILGILRTIASYLGIDISSSTLNYFVQKKLAFDISHSSFKKTTLKNVYYNVAGSSFNQTVSFDSYL
jgi:hypothetical protein